MHFATIFFDLDGTLTDSMPGITNSVAYALERFGISVEDKRTLIPFVGPPLMESFHKFYGFDHDKCAEAVKVYREYYTVKGLFENEVYPGIPEMLQTLLDGGLRLVVATAKPEVFAKQILDYFNLSHYFVGIYGATKDETRIHKDQVIEYAIREMGLEEKKDTICMVGDRENDISGAKMNGIANLGVLYGYGSREELTEAGAERLVKAVADIPKILLS